MSEGDPGDLDRSRPAVGPAETGLIPEPRPGLLGLWDRAVGPGASAAENIGTIALAFVGAIGAGSWAYVEGATTLQATLAAVLAFDVVAGVWANATAASRRWWHRAGTGLRTHLAFVVPHVHPFLVAWLFEGASWVWAAVLHGSIVLAVVFVARMPRPLQTPTSLVLCVPIVAAAHALAPGVLPWLAPALALKLVAGHVPADVPGGTQSGS